MTLSRLLKNLCILKIHDLRTMSDQDDCFCVQKIVRLSDDDFAMHVGKNYENLILNAEKQLRSVVRILNVNGRSTSLPLERALSLLQRYYVISGEQPASLHDERETPQIQLEPDYQEAGSENYSLAEG
jgi:hypothetical protein